MNPTIEQILKQSALSRDYTIEKKISSGGFSTVFLAEKKEDKSLIAIKALESKGQSLADYFREIKVSKTLNHPHNIKVIDFYIYDSQNAFFILMELAQKSLNDLIREKVALEEELIYQLLADVVSGLQYASDTSGISHCDLKPQNILLVDKMREKGTQTLFISEPKTTFKLVDWGCAVIQEKKINNTVTQTLKNPYTKAYSAPEIIQNAPRINLMKADVYSLGLTLLTCCGVSCKTFKYINSLTDEEEHGLQVKNIIKSNDLDGKYENLIKIISPMISYDHKERPDYNEILSKISKYQSKYQKLHCFFCKKKHENVVKLPDCSHFFGVFCLVEHFKSEFEKNPFYVPCCPIISCQNILETSELKDVLGRKLFQKNYNKCRKCEKIILNLNSISFDLCNHGFCFKCFKTFSSTGKCPVDNCEMEFSDKEKSIFEVQSAKCLKCGKNNGTMVDFSCCDAKLCDDCIPSVAGHISQENPCCLFCRRKLKTEIKDAIDHIVTQKKKEEKSQINKKSSKKSNEKVERISNSEERKGGEIRIENNNTPKNQVNGKRIETSPSQNTIVEESKTMSEIEQRRKSMKHKAESLRKKGFNYEELNPVDYEQAFNCFLEAANLGDKIAMQKVGFYYSKGLGCQKNDQEAFSFFKQSAKLDYIPAILEVAKLFKTKGDLKKAAKYFKKAADYDNAQANDELAIIYESQKEYELAIQYYTRSIELGFGRAANNLAWLYEFGIENFMPPNKELAEMYKNMAEDLGHIANWNKNKKGYDKDAAHSNWLKSNGIQNN